VLAVRMLVAKIAWLEGALYWREGRIAWVTPEGELSPGPSDLSRTQRILNKLRQYPIAGPLALGDAAGWIEERQQRFELAKKLAGITAADLNALVESARSSNQATLEKLALILPAEALCLNGLPTSPASALLSGRERGEPILRQKVEDPEFPLAGRALAALTLGALRRKLDTKSLMGSTFGLDWLDRAYRWGSHAGLPEEPGLITTLLAAVDGAQLSHRMVAATDRAQRFRLESPFLRELLAQGIPGAKVVELAEAYRDAVPVAERYLAVRDLLPQKPKERREMAEALHRQRREWVRTFEELLLDYARGGDPAVVRLATTFALQMLDLNPTITPFVTTTHMVLREIAALARPLHRACLELFVDEHARMWGGELTQTGNVPGLRGETLKNWLDQQWSLYGAPVRGLLAVTQDPALVREVLQRDHQSTFACLHLPSVEYYHYILSIVRELELPGDHMLSWRLSNILRDFQSATMARAALQPLIRAVSAAPKPQRGELLRELLYELPDARRQVREMTARLARHVPALLRFSPAGEEWAVCSGAIEAAGVLEKEAPAQSEEWFPALLTTLQQWLCAKPVLAERLDDLGNYARLGLALADGDRELFLTVVHVAVNHPPRQSPSSLQAGIEALSRFPGLRAALAQVFPRQPHRCVDLLVRLGLATRLGAEVLSPLEVLEAPECPPEVAPAWSEVLRLAPELAPLTHSFLHAQELQGLGPDLPPGISRALALPQKLAGELAHLEQRVSADPSSRGIAARIANLRTRLQDEPGLAAVIREEIGERLTDLTASARIAAAERQVIACYRARLEQVAGPLPDELELTEDWLNAALLSASISENRHLLKRLLRTCATGDPKWRGQHPENVRFLQALAERGVDTQAWQRGHPRRFCCPEVPGGVVRLRFEQDPLHILQMGNYFDTCLSFNGCNNYSTIANACELNKRVLYARDAAGRVIARKLIGINADGSLIGYMTYSTLSGESGKAVQRLVRYYVGEFASKCQLQLANAGTVPRLFAERWYDDGLQNWDDETVPPPRKEWVPSPSSGDPLEGVGTHSTR